MATRKLTLGEAFGLAIVAQRKKKNLKQIDLAEETGYSEMTIRSIEHGRKSPTLRTMEDLAIALGVLLEKLIAEARRLQST